MRGELWTTVPTKDLTAFEALVERLTGWTRTHNVLSDPEYPYKREWDREIGRARRL